MAGGQVARLRTLMPCVAVRAVSQLAMLWGSVFAGGGGGGSKWPPRAMRVPVPASKAMQAGWPATHLPLKLGVKENQQRCKHTSLYMFFETGAKTLPVLAEFFFY